MAKNTMTPRELDELNRQIMRENKADERRERFLHTLNNAFAGLPYENQPMLSFDAILRALTDIKNTGKYTLPADMPKCERNSLFTRLDRIARLYVPS